MRIGISPSAELLFERVRMEHGEKIRGTLRRLVDEPDREDVEADIWVSVWTALRRFEGRSSVGTFIFPIARRRIADHFRAKYRDERLLAKAKSQIKAEDYIVSEEAPGTVLPTPAELRILRCLADGKSNDAIAADLFVSKDTVRSHIKSLYRKTKIRDRGTLVLLAYRFFKEKTS